MKLRPSGIIMVGTMSPAAEPFHAVCAKPALQQGRALRLENNGVTDIGLVAGCEHCNAWILIDALGNMIEISLKDDKEDA